LSYLTLTDDERQFCSLVAKAGTSNHFSKERMMLDSKIAQVPVTKAKNEIFKQVITTLTAFISEWEKQGKADVRKYGAEDREIVAFTLLFDIFHLFMNEIDRHITEQLNAGDKPIVVSYAHPALELFSKRGFDLQEATLFMGIFFQLRRAYYFIENQIIGNSPCMISLRENLWNNVFTNELLFYRKHLLNRMEDFSTLILGDTGSGKGTAAAAIGRSGYIPFDPKTNLFSESFASTFSAINLSQFSQGLIESELFGHKKGAFTGAVDDHKGVFARCSKQGSIFLDEIGDVSIPVQIKLLQILQERTFTSIGSHTKQRFEGRVIAATNKDISSLRQKGEFRDDFFYRLCSDIIVMPSLAQRIDENPQELESLVAHVVKRIVGVEQSQLVNEVLNIIKKNLGESYRWPGNVRELEQCVRRIILKKEYHGDHSVKSNDSVTSLLNEISAGAINADTLLGRYCKLLYDKHKSYEAVSEIVQLDRRTVKKYIDNTK
jgi:DNA-binding NtrC family response regulator